MSRSISSADLDKRLKKLVQQKNAIEKEYQETNQRFWTILFIDVSTSAKNIWKLGEVKTNELFAQYQQIIRSTLQKSGCSFIEPGGGSQVVCCFDYPETGLLAAQSVMHVMEERNRKWPKDLQLIPAIGIHQGFINFHDGTIHQSNTNNLAKRIQTEAAPGHIFVSKEIRDFHVKDPQFSFKFVGSCQLKNIPEPQDIFEVTYRTLADIDAFSIPETIQDESQTAVPQRKSYHWIFVYVDVCESTKKFWNFGDREASSLIHEYQKLCHKTFQQSGSIYSKSCEGDQIIGAFEFEDANMAVVAAIKIMKELFRRNLNSHETKQVHTAMGIHGGELILEREEPVTTTDMRVGKSIQSLATSDEILLSNEVSQLLDFQLQDYITHYGSYEFSGIPSPMVIKTLNWPNVKLRPSLIHPPIRTRIKRTR